MANVFDTAEYILKEKGHMSTMKLQKLCYYSQAWSLVWDDTPLFNEDFEAWVNGPVCRPLFEKTKGKFSVTAEDETGGEGNLSCSQKETIKQVLEHYSQYDAQYLSRLTHLEDPWKLARANMPENENGNNIITKESMAMYYGGL